MQLNGLNPAHLCITHEWGFWAHENCSGVIRARWHLGNAWIYKPERREQECFCRNSGFGRVNPGLQSPLNAAFTNHITQQSVRLQRSPKPAGAIPAAPELKHIIYILQTCNSHSSCRGTQRCPAHTAAPPELVVRVLIAAEPRTVLRHKSVFA